jgi:hypothetical protein
MKTAVLFLTILSLSACSYLNADSASVARVCPAVHVWSKEDQKRLAAYYAGISGTDAPLVKEVFKEWISLHRQAESCQE